MSLISDALKEAQRERSERTAPRPPAVLGESFFPYPSSKKRAAPNRALVLGGTAVLVLAILGFGVGRVITAKNAARRNAIAATRPVGQVARTVSAPPKAAETKAADPAPPLEVKAKEMPAHDVIASETRSTRVEAKDPRRVEAAAVSAPRPVAPKDTAAPLPSANLPSTALAAVATGASSPVRVVVDPVGLRPGDSLFARAYAEHMRGNLDGAADLYEKAIQKPPVSPELYNDYGALLASRGNHTAALAMYRIGLAAKNDDAKLWINVADSYKALGRRADALSAYFQAAKLDPSNVTVKLRLAGEYQAIGDTTSARRGYEDAVHTAPKDPEAHYNFGSFLQSQRDYPGAIRELQAFVDFAPGRFSQDFIERTKTYISNLRRQFP